jgi:2-oxoglutarate ferredoxin oxidoreductase subunit alpha
MVNNFSIVIASTNGTGSQTANLTVLRALFKMGIPVGSKNIFPSNIQGLPTWYFIRLSSQGFVAHRKTAEILVAFNHRTFEEDLAKLPAGGVCIHPDEWTDSPNRDDVTIYTIPVDPLIRQIGARGRSRDYLTNMIYVGALSQILEIELSMIEQSLVDNFGDRPSLLEQNFTAVSKAYEWTRNNIDKKDPFRVETQRSNSGKMLITGNEAAALGAAFGGVTLASWYPITPATSLIDALSDVMPRLRIDAETGKPTYAIIQAEDELSAIGMVIGAGWAGARAMTATSGPGISLMTEFASLGYFAEIPAVIWDVQRIGPSTGLPTRTSQGDILSTYFLGHGDSTNVLLLPGTVAECFEFGWLSFDLADQLQTPVFVMSDLDLGMNTWMSDSFEYPDQPIKRGKILSASEVEDVGFGRFLDVDGDGIPYRTLPGNEHPLAAYLGRGTGHNSRGQYSERPEDWEENMERLSRKFETVRVMMPPPAIDERNEVEIGIIAYGSTLPAVEEARSLLSMHSMPTSFLRLRALPIGEEVQEFVDNHEIVYVLELNRDGQLHKILTIELPLLAEKLISVSRVDGLPMTADWILEQIGSNNKEK